MKTAKAVVHQVKKDKWSVHSQSVDIDGQHKFSVYNMCECPEDAIIGRDLFDAADYISAVRFGIELAKAGFDALEVEFIDEESDF